MPPIDQNGKINGTSRLRPQQHAERIQSRKNNPYQKMRNDQVKGLRQNKKLSIAEQTKLCST